MVQTFAFCQTQVAFHRERAASAPLENVRIIATKAAAAWGREAELARVREARRSGIESLPAAGSPSEEAEDALSDEDSDLEAAG